jgi:hypothetical protein
LTLTRTSVVVAGIAVATLALFLLYLAGGPLHSDDLWFHLVLGEHFLAEGLCSGWDPILYTAHQADPLQHEWLFGLLVHGVDKLGGFTALRIVSVLAPAAALGLAWSVFRREAPTRTAAFFAMGVFLSLSWSRLHQLRPHLTTIPLIFVMYHLLLAPDRALSWWRVLATAPLMLIWANLHPGFVVGLLLLIASLMGIVLRAIALGHLVGEHARAHLEWARARRLGAATLLGLLASTVNPRGVDQLLTFLLFRDTAALPGRDDWAGFRPWQYVDFGGQMGGFEFVVTNALMAVFVIAVLVGLWRFLKRPSTATLLGIEPVALGLASTSFLAMLIAIRFNWLCAFLLVFLLRSYRSLLEERPHLDTRLAPIGCAVTLALVVGFFTTSRYDRFAIVDPRLWDAPYTASKFYVPGTQFLGEVGVEGHAFNAYNLGGFLGYWLRPRVLAFIDGRNEAYPPEVYRDYERVILQRGATQGEDLLELLDRREVDLFFGNGYAYGRIPGIAHFYSTAHLEGAPGWILVFRSVDHAIYLRDNERNRENLERIAAFYAREGVPFDAASGFDVEAVIGARADWAISRQMLPLDYPNLLRLESSPGLPRRPAALARLGVGYALIGAWQRGLAVDRELLELRPHDVDVRIRVVHALLRLWRVREALEEMRELRRLAPNAPATQVLERVARSRARLRDRGVQRWHAPTHRALNELPLLDRNVVWRALAGRFAAAGRIDPSRFEGAPGS